MLATSSTEMSANGILRERIRLVVEYLSGLMDRFKGNRTKYGILRHRTGAVISLESNGRKSSQQTYILYRVGLEKANITSVSVETDCLKADR